MVKHERHVEVCSRLQVQSTKRLVLRTSSGAWVDSNSQFFQIVDQVVLLLRRQC